MKVLVIGGGGREHALVWKISQSPWVKKIYCAPGNGGISDLAENVDIPVQDISRLLDFASSQKIDLTVVGPELPLTLGIVDTFEKKGLKIFGPCQSAARLEGSKIFAKKMMKKYGIPTAPYEVFCEFEAAQNYLKKVQYPLVIKADGLASGKGVLVAENFEEAHSFTQEVMVKKIFGNAGHEVLIEKCLVGREMSFLVFSDGKTFAPLPEARDHKRVFDHDEGPNTGGMGAFSPVPEADSRLKEKIMREVFDPLLTGMAKEGVSYQGVLYAGLMLTRQGPQVLEFNVRFGDPETEVILPRLKGDLLPILLACTEGKLSPIKVEISDEVALGVVMVSGGYPGTYQNGYEIQGLNGLAKEKNVFVFHAGTQKMDGRYLTSGGRVLCISALGKNFSEARSNAYRAAEKIQFEKMHYRKDIGLTQLKMKN
ncbi:MAG: phosphoribosylamine--glycine ligase [Chlamydiae bacterium]|nr:phosphoribosylamine--glycine ligase [Chlamydiota bacterium]MBI3266130.1 phosphoribosylamine--glycine ligase [Chlamydiota bacterium]